MFDTRTVGSAPELFRNFGCGAVLSTAPILLTDTERFFTVLALADRMVGQFPGLQFALVATLVFAFYIIGAACVILGDALFSIFPRMYLEREMETEAAVLRGENSSLIQTLSSLQRNVENIHAAVGVGILGCLTVVNLDWGEFTWSTLSAVALFALATSSAIQRRIWITYKYRIFVRMVLDGPITELNDPALAGKPSASSDAQGTKQ